MKPLQMNWNKSDGLIPAIVQDAQTKEMLMLGYFNQESLDQTLKTGKVTFFSRTRQSLWTKGETSGNFFSVVEIKPDCDQDALLILVDPKGPACHRETTTCFEHDFEFLSTLEKTIQNRIDSPSSASYTSKLLQEGLDRVIQKVGEEGIETVIAAKNNDIAPLESEAADLIYHLMVLLQAKKTSLKKVVKLLGSRSRSERPS